MRSGEGVFGDSMFDNGGVSSEKVAEDARLRPGIWLLPFREGPHVDMNDITAREKKRTVSPHRNYRKSPHTISLSLWIVVYIPRERAPSIFSILSNRFSSRQKKEKARLV